MPEPKMKRLRSVGRSQVLSEIESISTDQRLGGVEKFSTCRHALGLYKNVGVSATYSISEPWFFQKCKQVILSALSEVISQHPILSAIAVNENTQKPFWVRLPQIDLQDCVVFVPRSRAHGEASETDEELATILEAQHNKDFKGKVFGELPTPFWRAVVLCEQERVTSLVISFIFHHALADTASGIAFHRSLLVALLRQKKDDTANDVANETNIVQAPNLPLLPPLENLHPLPLSLRFIWKEAKAALFSRPTSGLWAGAPVPVSITNNPKTHFQFFSMTESTTSNFVATCRANNATVTSTLQLFLAAALFAHLPLHFTTLNVEGAISFRRFLDPDIVGDDSMGCWVSRYLSLHQRNSKSTDPLEYFSWHEAGRIRKSIESELARRARTQSLPCLGSSSVTSISSIRWLEDQGKQASSFQMLESSVEAKRQRLEDWRIGRMVFSQSADVTGAAFEVSVVTGKDGRLSMGFSWFREVVEDVVVEKIMELVKQLIEETSGK